jgi:hypothetical protein
MHVPRNELVVGVGYADKGPVGVAPADAESAQERTVWSPSGTGVDAMTDAFQDDSQTEMDQTKNQAFT